MTAKTIDYIIIYSFLGASTLCYAVLARLFVIKVMQLDEFSGLMVFTVVCLFFIGFYFSFQTILNVFLLPVVKRFFRKMYPQIEPEFEVKPISIESTTSQDKVALPNYEEYKQIALQKFQQEQAQTLENVLAYAEQELLLFITKSELKLLCKHICLFQLANEKECEQINTPVTVDTKLKSIDLMHFGWNVGNQFRKSGIETATFIKHVFATPFEKVEVSTIKRKLRVEGTCIIKIKEEI